MPAYTELQPVTALTSKAVGYSFGTPPQSASRIQLSHFALTSDVVTIVGTLVEGPTPLVDDEIYSVVPSSVGSGATNRLVGVITGVTGPDANGVVTITYSLTASNISGVATPGYAVTIPQPQGELAATGAGQVFAVMQGAYGLSWDFSFPGASAITIQLEGAIENNPDAFMVIGDPITNDSGLGGAIAQLPANVNFVRINNASFSGSGNGWARILAS